MATYLENARVTELHVGMDCNGCVQRIKKAIYSIDGIYNLSVDISQQKLIVVGRADPETPVKVIKKTRKTAIVSSHTDPSASEPPSEAPPAEADPPALTNEPPPQENPTPEESKPSTEPQEPMPIESKVVEEVQHMVHEYPHGHVIREHWNNHPHTTHEAPYYFTHSNNPYGLSPYVIEHGYLRSPPQDMRYNSMETYNYGYYQNTGSEEYYQNRASDHGNRYNSMFSDENPNACSIV